MHLDPGLRVDNRQVLPPRTIGSLILSSKAVGGRSGLDRFRSEGSLRATFPRRNDAVEAILVNTSGGLTGGDRLRVTASAQSGSRMVLTTQAAERAYRSTNGSASVRSHLTVESGAYLAWLPQELIVFDNAALDRRLEAEVAEGAELLIVEPVIFGRTAMGEVVERISFQDHIRITRGGCPLYNDRVALVGSACTHLATAATAAGMGAMATAIYVGPRAEAMLDPVRAILPVTGGASILGPGILVMRMVATDGHLLRQSLCPVLETLSDAALPRSWRL